MSNLELKPGDNIVSVPVEHPSARVLGQPPAQEVHVRVTVEVGPHPAVLPGQNSMATTLEFRMRPRVALDLASEIHKIARGMGWPKPE